MANIKKYYYHVTQKYWGKEITLKPKIKGIKRDLQHEPKVKRICVSSNIEGCLAAIYLFEMEEWNVYRTKNKVVAHKTKDIPDSKITSEYWLKRPTKFVYHGSVRGRHFAKIIKQSYDFFDKNENELFIGDGVKRTLKHQLKIKNNLKKLIKENKIVIKKLPKNKMYDSLEGYYLLEFVGEKYLEELEVDFE